MALSTRLETEYNFCFCDNSAISQRLSVSLTRQLIAQTAGDDANMTDLQKWAMALLIWLLCITASFLWIDRPVAFLVHTELEGYRAIFDVTARLPKVLGPLVVACTLLIGVWVVVGQRITEIQTIIVISALSWAVLMCRKIGSSSPSAARGPTHGCKIILRSSAMASTILTHFTGVLASPLSHPVTWWLFARSCRSSWRRRSCKAHEAPCAASLPRWSGSVKELASRISSSNGSSRS